MKRKTALKSLFLRLTALLLAFLLCSVMIACGNETRPNPDATDTDVTTGTDVTPDVPGKDTDVTTKSDVPTDTPVTPDEPEEPTGTDIDVTTSTDVTEPDMPTEPDESDDPVVPDEPDEPVVPDEPDEPIVPDEPDEGTSTDVDEPDEPLQPMSITLPAESVTFSTETALSLLPFCNVITKDDFAATFAQYGFSVVTDGHFDKSDDDESHTSAWMLGEGTVKVGDTEKTAYLLVIRATHGGEWASNLNVLPTRNYDSETADNFYFSALDVLASISDLLQKTDDHVFIVTGYSRGAAVANLIGREMDRTYPERCGNVYVYTFATPLTVTCSATDVACPNVFNVINNADFVTTMPLAAWNYVRAGRDIVLPADEALTADVAYVVNLLSEIVPSVFEYYEKEYTVLDYQYTLFGAIEELVLPSISSDSVSEVTYSATTLSVARIYPFVNSGGMLLSSLTGNLKFNDIATYINSRRNLYTLLKQHVPTTYASMLQVTLY